MYEGALVPETVKVGSWTVTWPTVAVSVFGERVNASGVRSITRVKDVVSPLEEVKSPVMVALPAVSPQTPEEGVFIHLVITVLPGAFVTAAEVTQVPPPSTLNSMHPLAVRVPGGSAQVKEAVPGIVVGATAPVIGVKAMTAGAEG
jgi:hypothetical protein